MTHPTPEQMHELYCLALGRVAGLGEGGCAERVGPWLLIDAGLGVSKFNIGVVVEHVDKPRPALKLALDWFEARGLNPRLDLRGSVDGGVLAAAMVSGFSFWWREPSMVLHPIPDVLRAPPPELETRTVTNREELELYCAADRDEFSDQDFQLAMAERAAEIAGVSMHLGLVDGRPVARSMAIRSGDLVGVYNVYTSSELRGRGYGTAVTTAAIAAGRAEGAVSACLESTMLGFPVYEALGFRRIDDYVIVGTEDPAGTGM